MAIELVDLFGVVHCHWWCGVSDDYDELDQAESQALEDDLWVARCRPFAPAAGRRSDGEQRSPG